MEEAHVGAILILIRTLKVAEVGLISAAITTANLMVVPKVMEQANSEVMAIKGLHRLPKLQEPKVLR
jgi:hypothetical protein